MGYQCLCVINHYELVGARIYYLSVNKRYNIIDDFILTSHKQIKKASEYIQDKFVEEYGSFLCDDIRLKLFGRLENVPMSEYEKECPFVCENAAGWTVKAILANK